MSISPTSDIADPRRAGPPLRLTPEVRVTPEASAGSRRAVADSHAESGSFYDGAAGNAATTSDGEELSFWDFLDVINPLQHIPVVSTLYRELTGDQIKTPAKLAGGALFGGVIGLAASTADVLLKEASGRDAGEHVMALFDGEGDDAAGDAATTVAANDPASAPAASASASASAAAAAPGGTAETPVATAANSRWFPINRDQHVRADAPARQPVSEAALRGRPTVEVLSPKAADAAPASQSADPPGEASAPALPLGVVSAASVVSAQEHASARASAALTPSPAALRKAMAAQGLAPDTAHPMLSGAEDAGAPAGAPAALPQSSGPVDVPAWFDKAMQRYSTSDRLAPSESPALVPAAAPAVRRGV